MRALSSLKLGLEVHIPNLGPPAIFCLDSEVDYMQGEQLDLLDPQLPSQRSTELVPRIEGLRYVEEFLSVDEQKKLLRVIDAAEWRYDLDRRVQHYGWRYDYKARTVSRDMRIRDFPMWLHDLGKRLCEAGLFKQLPDQGIVNEYRPGQGIAMHVDRRCFGPEIATVSLGDAWRMNLRPLRAPPGDVKHILLDVGSVLALSGEARYRWMHGIPPRKRERQGHGWRPRVRRVSVTFRTVLLSE